MGLESTIIAPSPVIVPGEVRKGFMKALFWQAKVAPKTPILASYGWAQQGQLVTFWFRISADLPGVKVRGLSFPLPPEVVHPDTFPTELIPDSCDLFLGVGGLAVSRAIKTKGWKRIYSDAIVSLRQEKTGPFLINLQSKHKLDAAHAWGTLHYYA